MKKRLLLITLLFFTQVLCSAQELSFSEKTLSQSSNNSLDNNLITKYANGRRNNSNYYNHSHHHHHHYTFGDFIIDIIDLAWILNNITVEFDTYPYAHGDYLEFDIYSEENYSYDWESEEPIIASIPTFHKSYRFESEINMIYMFNSKTPKTSIRFEGFFWRFFGPVAEYTFSYNLKPSRHYPIIDPSGTLRLGMQIALFQSNFLSLSTAIEWDHKYGNQLGIYDDVALEFIFRSYPVNPLVIEDRVIYSNGNYRNCGIYDDPAVIENTLELGFMIDNGFSITMAYRYLFNMYQDYIDNGISVGLKYHF